MSRATLTRVIYEYSDGTKKYITNEELDKWMKFNSLVAETAELHNINPPWKEIKWTKLGKDLEY